LSKENKIEFSFEDAQSIMKQTIKSVEKKNLLKPEPYRFFLKDGYDTAAWSYRPPHYIILGTDIFQHFTAKENQARKYYASYVLHEIAHSIYTDYRLFKIIQIIEEKDLPFEVYNLFEDARIEASMRKNMGRVFLSTTPSLFNWDKYTDLQTPDEVLELFFWCVQTEGDKTKFDNLKKHLNADLLFDAKRVWNFYEKTIKAKNSYEVINIVEEWMQHFSEVVSLDKSTLFKGELQVLQAPDSIISDIKGASEVFSIGADDLKDNQNSNISYLKSKENQYSITRLSNSNLLSKKPVRDEFDKNLLEKITREIEKLFIKNRRYVTTQNPSKRLHLRNILLKNPSRYKKRAHNTLTKKNVSVIMDISGSMTHVIEKMLILVEALNILSKRELIVGHLVLCMSDEIGKANYQTFSFPIKDDVIRYIPTYRASEGISSTMKHLVPFLRPSDFALVFTDGIFVDDPLDKTFFKQNNIKLCGVYLSEQNPYGYNLRQYFDTEIVESDILELTISLIKVLKGIY